MATTTTKASAATSPPVEEKAPAEEAPVSEYAVPSVEMTPEDEMFLNTVVRTSDQAQVMFLQDNLTEDQLAMAVGKFGMPSNGSETVNRLDEAFDKKLPKWVFRAPEGTGLTMEQRMAEVAATTPEPGPLTHEQIVVLPPEEQAAAAAAQEGAVSETTTDSSTPETTS